MRTTRSPATRNASRKRFSSAAMEILSVSTSWSRRPRKGSSTSVSVGQPPGVNWSMTSFRGDFWSPSSPTLLSPPRASLAARRRDRPYCATPRRPFGVRWHILTSEGAMLAPNSVPGRSSNWILCDEPIVQNSISTPGCWERFVERKMPRL